MATSQNGYSVRASTTDGIEKWNIPFKTGPHRHLYLRKGHVGFILAWFASWYHDRVEKLNIGTWDEWGWAYRQVRGSTDISNHASGTAADLNATRHPLAIHNTFKALWQIARIHFTLRVRLRGTVRWGGDYNGRVDEMHFEMIKQGKIVRKVAKALRNTRRGKQIWAANPHYMHRQWRRMHR